MNLNLDGLIRLLEYAAYLVLVVFFSFWLRKITRYEIKKELKTIRLLKKVLLITGGFFTFFIAIWKYDILFVVALIAAVLWFVLILRWKKRSMEMIGFSPLVIVLLATSGIWFEISLTIIALDSFASTTLIKGKKENDEIESYPKELFWACINYVVPLCIGFLAGL